MIFFHYFAKIINYRHGRCIFNKLNLFRQIYLNRFLFAKFATDCISKNTIT